MADLYAMLIGIDRYAGGKVPNLSGCVNDIDDVLDLLRLRTSAGTELRPLVLRNEEATVAAVVDGLRHHLTRAGRGDAALLWFCGHGSEAPLPSWGAWFEEPTGMLQTLVCADSRSGGVRDLLDKELSVLLDQVAAGGAHVAVVLDSCHSDGATRELGTSKRGVRPADGVLSWESLLPELAARIAAPERSRSPEHVVLAACRRDEETEERTLDHQPRGLFSWSLLDAMRRLGPGASYRDLLIAAQTEMAQRRAYRQVPQLYPAASDLIHEPFLGGKADRPDPSVVMSYGADGWEINAGSAHGLPVGAPGMRVGRPGDSPVREADIIQVQTVRSLVCPAGGWHPERNRQFRVVLTEMPLPATTVSVTGDDPAAIESLDRAIRTAGPAGGPSVHVRRCACRECHPCWSSSMFVFVEESAESVTSVDGQVGESVVISDRFGQRCAWSEVGDAPVRPVVVVMAFVLAQGMQQMGLVEDQSPVEQFMAAGLNPPFHDRVHPGHPDAAEHDLDPGVGKDGVDQGRVLAVAIADQVSDLAAGVFEVHDQVPGGLGHPGGGRVRGDTDPAGGVLDHGQHVQAGAGQRHGFEEVDGEDGLGLGVQKRRPGGARTLGCRVDAGVFENLPNRGGGDLHAQGE